MENFSEVSDTVTFKYARIHEKSETSVAYDRIVRRNC